MIIKLGTPLNINVSKIAAYFPEYVYRKPFMGSFGYINSELIRNDRSRDKPVILFFDAKVSQGFTEIRTDYNDLFIVKNLLEHLPDSLRSPLLKAIHNAFIIVPPYQLHEQHSWTDYFNKMPSAKKLEQLLRPQLKLIYGQMRSTANTDIKEKTIRLNALQAPLKIALSYVYELKNLSNSEHYLKIYKGAKANAITKSQFVKRILHLEAEAVYFRSLAFDEHKLPKDLFPCQKAYLDIYLNNPSEKKAIVELTSYLFEHGMVKKGWSAKKYYADLYDSIRGKKQEVASYEAPSQPRTIVL